MAEEIGHGNEITLSRIGQENEQRKLTGSAPQKLILSDLRREKASGSAPVQVWGKGFFEGKGRAVSRIKKHVHGWINAWV